MCFLLFEIAYMSILTNLLIYQNIYNSFSKKQLAIVFYIILIFTFSLLTKGCAIIQLSNSANTADNIVY